MKVRIDEIKVNPGRRAALESNIEELAFSISEIGLLNPITLTGDYTLVAGLHRLEAVKLLGWTEVECTLEIGDLYRRRKDIYEMLYPETKAGTAQAIGMNKAKGNNVDCNLQSRRKSFIEDTAGVTGSHPSTIARHIKIATDLTPEAKETLRGAEKPVSSTTLKKISKLAPDQQKEVSTLLVSGEIQTVDEYLTKGQPQESESLTAERFPKEQIAAMMGMAYFADGVIAHTNDFLKQVDTFAQMSRENLMDVLKMLDAINSSIQILSDMVEGCYSNS